MLQDVVEFAGVTVCGGSINKTRLDYFQVRHLGTKMAPIGSNAGVVRLLLNMASKFFK